MIFNFEPFNILDDTDLSELSKNLPNHEFLTECWKKRVDFTNIHKILKG
jgi:hypothetical protein